MSSNPRGERQVTHFADEHTLARLAELERENAELREDVRLLRKAFLGRDYDHLEVKQAIDAACQPQLGKK